MSRQLIIILLILLSLITATVLVVLYGKGYRFGFEGLKPLLSETGLLVATSTPDGAQVFIDDHLTTATNNTINLEQKEYKVKIAKAGYFPWEKKIKIKKEVVSKAEALLFTTAPKLESITDIGVSNPTLDPSRTKIAFTAQSQSNKKNGVYVLDMSLRPILTLQSALKQIADDSTDTFSTSLLSWSSDGEELLATISADLVSPTTYLLKKSEFNESPQDVTAILTTVNATWQKQREEKQKSRIFGLKPKLKKIIADNFKIISWSPDETKILYVASESATLPLVIDPPLLGTDSTPQERSLEKDLLYVYDIKEDKNLKLDIGNSQKAPLLSWFPDGKHLIFIDNKKIDIMEYDGTNRTVVYAGPFIDNFVFPWTDDSKIVILTNLGNPNTAPNLYTIGLK